MPAFLTLALLLPLSLAAIGTGTAAGRLARPALGQAMGTPLPGAICRPPLPASTPTPVAGATTFLGPTPTPVPEPDAVVDPLLADMTAAAVANLQACWNVRDWSAVAAIVTPRFLLTALGIETSDTGESAAALAALDLGPLRIEAVTDVALWSDGRGAVEVFYLRGDGHPSQAVAARWFLIAERGIVRFDEEIPLLPPPLGDRLTLGFSIADDQQPLRWDGLTAQIAASPVTVLHGANRGRARHTFVLEGADGKILGLLTLPSWHQGDLVLLGFAAGTYRLFDPAVTDSELTLVVDGG